MFICCSSYIALLLLLGISGAHGIYPKCCDSNSVLKIATDSKLYDCESVFLGKSGKSRFDVATNSTKYLEEFRRSANHQRDLEAGYCVDLEDEIALYKLTGNDVVKERAITNDVKFYPKCCPLKFHYDRVTHSCVESSENVEFFLSYDYFEIGLPKCKIIVDLPSGSNHNDNITILDDEGLRLMVEDGDGQKQRYDRGSFCVDRDENDKQVVRVCENDASICKRMKCITKCCQDGDSFVGGSKCKTTYVHGLNLSFTDRIRDSTAPFAIVHERKPLVYILYEDQFDFYIDAAGLFHVNDYLKDNSTTTTPPVYKVETGTYCVDNVQRGQNSTFFVFRAYPPQSIQVKFLYTRWAMVISCIFLLLTILYYVWSREIKTLFGKMLVSYCCAMFGACLILSYSAFDLSSSTIVCQISGFITLYFVLSSFVWMNILCIDIYCTFGSSKSFTCAKQKHKELRRFIGYSLYGWVAPLAWTATALLFYLTDALPSALRIIINGHKCYIQKVDKGNYAELLYSATPMTLLEICNTILFIKTIVYCMRVKNEISKMNDTQVLKGEKRNNFNQYKDRLSLLLKLFIIMGISFVFEVVSSYYDFKQNKVMAQIETVWDTFNSLQGVFIFLIFICKRRVFERCQKKLNLSKNRKISMNSAITTQTNINGSY